jgi:adenine-specific DNA-methyltransferase
MVSNNKSCLENNSIGQIFTPDYVAQFMVKNIISFVKEYKRNLQDLKVLEPSAGEGIFLKTLLQNKFSDITAFEMDLSLKKILLDLYPTIKFKFNNFLASKITDKYDIILGNPPYLGQNYNATVFQEYSQTYPICKKYFVGNMDLFYYFIHMGIEKLNPGGFLSFITTNYWISKSQKTGIKYLKPHILNECFLIQYIDLSNLKIFEDARGQQNCIFVLQKKTDQEIMNNSNKEIQIIQIIGNDLIKQKPDALNNSIFTDLIKGSPSNSIRKYSSASMNDDLKPNSSWNLLYPKEIKSIVDKIENFCKFDGIISKLNDFFIIRNGLILINDKIFILEDGKELRVEGNQFYILIRGEYFNLNEFEKKRLKKIYKSKSIVPYNYRSEDYIGYILYFNKEEYGNHPDYERNQLLEKKYPSLTKYLKQFEVELRETLINAKENPNDFYFPRRGSFIRNVNNKSPNQLVDLEPFYDSSQKIFFKYISRNNIFGYTNKPYYATSDTYFLWPKTSEKKINYLFLLAYLNSSIVAFLYNAKNITIKRSKTKLEYELPIPAISNLITEDKQKIVKLIENLTLSIIDNQYKKAHKNKFLIQKTIDELFIQLFDLDVKKISKLLFKYYDKPIN